LGCEEQCVIGALGVLFYSSLPEASCSISKVGGSRQWVVADKETKLARPCLYFIFCLPPLPACGSDIIGPILLELVAVQLIDHSYLNTRI
jgi:hypothetical protein